MLFGQVGLNLLNEAKLEGVGMAFIFYDTETTGISTSFDQILQFAAILTDDDLNELDRFEIRCRILPWVVPSPRALLTTGVTPDMLVDPSWNQPRGSSS